VATAIATAPRMLVTDEPTFGQDSRTWAELALLLADLRDEGRAVVMVTHDEALVDAVADVELRFATGTGTAGAAGPARSAP
jgi:energy-coupling factor transport system ATP-binding protein